MNIDEMRQKAFSYLDGSSDRKAERDLLKFLKESDGNKEIFSSWEEEWKSRKGSRTDISLLVSIEDKITARKRRMTAACSVAAGLVVLLSVFAVVEHGRPVCMEDDSLTVVETGPCDRTRVTLPDGSTVCLNSCSRLAYSSGFNDTERNVKLSGEALFEVRGDASRKFVVDMGQETIVVKGTRFNVSAYEKVSTVSVALMEGKVEFNEGENIISINPGEVLVFDKITRNLTKHPDDVSMYGAWVEGRIEYPSVTLNVLFDRLACIYNLDIRYVPKKYAEKTFSISLSTQENVRDILDAIAVIMPIRWTRNGNVIIINEI